VLGAESGVRVLSVFVRVAASHLDGVLNSSLIDGAYMRSYHDSATEREKFRTV
jgi:hypothetical protein